jgi:hypothetical protein
MHDRHRLGPLLRTPLPAAGRRHGGRALGHRASLPCACDVISTLGRNRVFRGEIRLIGATIEVR